MPAIADCGSAVSAPSGGWLAGYSSPTRDYPHGALGDDIEWRWLALEASGEPRRLWETTLQPERVFEDVRPRLADLDGDGRPEIVVVETSLTEGASLAIYAPDPAAPGGGAPLRIAATPYIGQANRWLAPVGIADLDGDGRVEIAYVDRPHLARVLRIVRLEGDALVEVAAAQGLTNHRFGVPDIEGGIRDCGAGPEMILADPGWTRTLAVRLERGTLTARDLGPLNGPLAADC